jgi:restriction system protein
MTRRKKSTAEDFIDLVAMFPWWVGVALAVLSYLALHQVATQPVASPVQPGQIGAMVMQTTWRALASVAQYVLPTLCVAGAGISAWRRRERKRLVGSVVRSDAADVLDGMTWQQFERLVGEGFRLQGYRVVETGGGGADGGVDLVLSKDGERYLVQCKQWRAFRVGVDVVRELYGVMAAKGVAGGFVVTSGRFTHEARSFAEGRSVQLIDGTRLRALIDKAGAAPTDGAGRSGDDRSRPTTPSAAASPHFPLCASPMVRRTAKRGPGAGNEQRVLGMRRLSELQGNAPDRLSEDRRAGGRLGCFRLQCLACGCFGAEFFAPRSTLGRGAPRDADHSTVTDFARFRGLSTSVPRAHAVWYASSCSGTTCRIGESVP